MSTGDVRQLLAPAALVAAWMLGTLLAGYAIWLGVTHGIAGQDAHAYWLTAHRSSLYGSGPREIDAFLYSPAFALAIKPIAVLPWPLFYILWVALEGAVLAWLVRPLPARWAVPAFLACVPELMIGNIFVLLAGMIAIGLRNPSVWAFGALTKITTGVGVVWFVARGEWRQFWTCVGVTVGIVAVSWSVDPDAWGAWARFLLDHTGSSGDGPFGLSVRIIVAAAMVVFAARTDRPWLVAVAVTVGAPVVGAVAALAPLAAIPRLAGSGGTAPVRRPDQPRVVAQHEGAPA